MLLVAGLPLFFLELGLGQYAGISPLKVFPRMAPIAAGLGYGMLMITFLVVIYYNLIIAWTIYYTFAGFAGSLPWARCGDDDLTSRDCYHREQDLECFEAGNDLTFWNKKCSPVSEVCHSFGLTLSSVRDNSSSSLMCFNGTNHLRLNQVSSVLRLQRLLHCVPGVQQSPAQRGLLQEDHAGAGGGHDLGQHGRPQG